LDQTCRPEASARGDLNTKLHCRGDAEGPPSVPAKRLACSRVGLPPDRVGCGCPPRHPLLARCRCAAGRSGTGRRFVGRAWSTARPPSAVNSQRLCAPCGNFA